MSLRFEAALRGDLKAFMAADLKAGERAVTNVITRRTLKLKQDIRGAVSGAGLGTRLGNTIRGRIFPAQGTSLGTKGRVESAAIYKRPGGLVDLITVFQEGATITAAGGKYLAIPVGAGKNEKLSSFSKKDIELVPFRNGRGYVVLRKGARAFGRGGGGVLFFLVKKATIRPRLDIESLRAAAENGIEIDLTREWESQAKAA